MRAFFLVAALGPVIACAEPASPRETLVMSPTSLELRPNATARLEVVGNATGVTWRSDAPAVASVDNAGLVTALTPGTTAVWAVRRPDSVSATVTVIRIVVCLGGPVVSPARFIIAPGISHEVEVRDGCVPAGAGFDWISGDTTVATVEPRETAGAVSTAIVHARANGQVVITARSRADPQVVGTIAVTVRSLLQSRLRATHR